jgi:hypothetical protein
VTRVIYGEHGGGVGGVVQDHVGDGRVHGIVGEGQVSDVAFGELNVVDAEAVPRRRRP